MTKFWSGLRETRRNGQALFPGKGRRFKSGQPHHKKPIFDNHQNKKWKKLCCFGSLSGFFFV
jgi:hypothetical protein